MPLNVRQRKLVKGIVEGKTGKEAAILAGYNPKSAIVTASQILANPNVQRAIDIALEKKGLNDERIAQVIDDGLKANRVISARITNKDADVDTDDFIEVPDHATRHKFLDTLVDIHGVKTTPPDRPIQVNILVQQSLEKIYDTTREVHHDGEGSGST